MEFSKNVLLKGKITCLTGLHIGGSKDKLEIGGVDSPVLRDPNTKYPYIPGSTIKGKLRSIIEFIEGKIQTNGKEATPHACSDKDCKICLLFGSSNKERTSGPTRLLIRDAFPDKETIDMWNDIDSQLQYTEYKPENTIDRLTSAANPRLIERVVPDSKFDFELVLTIYNEDADKTQDYFNTILAGLKMLEHSGIGGSVSRGYGQIKFSLTAPIVITKEDYIKSSDSYKKAFDLNLAGGLKPINELEKL